MPLLKFLFSPFGRSNRLQYLVWTLTLSGICLLAIVAVAGSVAASGNPTVALAKLLSGPGGISFLGGTLVAMLIFMWSAIAVTVRRFHDWGLSGWWYLGLLIANGIFGAILVKNPLLLTVLTSIQTLVFLTIPGQRSPNYYGGAPKGMKRGLEAEATDEQGASVRSKAAAVEAEQPGEGWNTVNAALARKLEQNDKAASADLDNPMLVRARARRQSGNRDGAQGFGRRTGLA
ncbi:MAG: DUF805 domain-containing protein [Pseudomonadota bacterium]